MQCKELARIVFGVFLASMALVLATAWSWLVPAMVGYCLYCNEIDSFIEGL